MEERLRDLLQGRVGYVIAGLRRRPARDKLGGPKRKVVKSAVEHLSNNRAHMRYDEYLAAAYPIGSGVVDGACRHLVKDRLEQTGMRWTVEGSQAMLHVRALYLNGQWEEFLGFRIGQEQTWLYGSAAAKRAASDARISSIEPSLPGERCIRNARTSTSRND